MIPEIVGLASQRPMLLDMHGSVGLNGKNGSDDVKLVQTLLNGVAPHEGGPTPKLVTDGRSGPLTIAAIQKFQKVHLKGFSDGRVDAPGTTIRTLAQVVIDSGTPIAPVPGLSPAAQRDVAGLRSMFEFPFSRVNAGNSPLLGANVASSSLVAGSRSTGFGAPFTRTGWTIDNNAFSFDVSIKDNGAYVASLEIFQDADHSIRQKLRIIAAIKNVKSIGPPGGLDFSLPSFESTKGVVFRGLTGIGPISAASFAGVCNIGFIGSTFLTLGVSMSLFQFQWGGPSPPGLCMGAAGMVGQQKGIPGIALGGGVGLCVPI
jgi:hypothetical protein